MMRLNPIPPEHVRNISFYVENASGFDLTIAVFSRQKQRYARVILAPRRHTNAFHALNAASVQRLPESDRMICDLPLSDRTFARYFAALQALDIEAWKERYAEIPGANAWRLRIWLTSGRQITSQGRGEYPSEWFELLCVHELLWPFLFCLTAGWDAFDLPAKKCG